MNTSIYSADFVSINGLTDPGRSGKNNEDSWNRFSILVPDGANQAMQHAELIVVADGIGGARGGEVASSLAVQEIGKLMESERTPNRSIEQRLDAAISAANELIYQRSAKEPDLQGMGTTILAVVITQKRRCYVAHAGDSRAYLVRGNRIHLLTQDHTRVQEMVDMGRITMAEAKDHPNRHVVSRFVGINDTVPVDLNILQYTERPDEKAAKALYIDVQPGDTLIACSDGLNDMLEDAEILELVRRNGVQNGPNELVKAANLKGGDDNITAVVASVLGAGGVAVTPVAGIGTKRSFPMAAVLGIVALLLLVAGGGYMMLNGGFPGGVVAGSDVATPTSETAIAVAPSSTMVAGDSTQPPTATTGESQTTSTGESTPTTGNGDSPIATSTRLVPTATNTPVPTDTPRPTNTRAPATATTAGSGNNNPSATQPPQPTRAPSATPGSGGGTTTTTRTQVILTGPANNESFSQGSAVPFSWQAQSLGAGESYNLRIWKQSSPNTLEREAFTTGTSASMQGLNPEVYQWSVQIVGGNGVIAGTQSNVRSFSVSGSGGGDTPDPGPEPTTPPTQIPPTEPPPPTDPPIPVTGTPRAVDIRATGTPIPAVESFTGKTMATDTIERRVTP